MSDKGTTTIALLGGDTVVGHVLSLLLRGAGYETRILEAPPTGMAEDLLEGVDLLLLSPGYTNGRREHSLASLRGTQERMHVPVLELSSSIKESLLDDEVRVVPWPTNVDALAHEIEGALKAAVHDAQIAPGGAEKPPPEEESAPA